MFILYDLRLSVTFVIKARGRIAQSMCVQQPCQLQRRFAFYLRSLTTTGVEHVPRGLCIVLTGMTTQPRCDEQGINGTPR